MINLIISIYVIILLNVLIGVLLLYAFWFINTWEMRKVGLKGRVGWIDNTNRIINPHE